MKKSRIILSVFAVLFFVVAIVVCVGIVVPSKETPSGLSSKTILEKNYENLNQEETNQEENKQEDSSVVPDDTTGNDIIADETKSELEYFINSKSVKKVKEISGETTVFNLNFKLFVMNDSKTAKTVLANAFSASYNIGEYGLLYTFTCNEDEKYFSLEAGEVVDLDFTLKYIVTNTDKFLDFEKYDLVINYMLEEVLAFNV